MLGINQQSDKIIYTLSKTPDFQNQGHHWVLVEKAAKNIK